MKWRKFAHKQTENKQTLREQSLNSKTEATLILCGSSGERANILFEIIHTVDTFIGEYKVQIQV